MNVQFDEIWKKARITNDFFFGKVMQNPKLCKRLLEIILNIKIERIEYTELQKTMDITQSSKSIRLDVYVQDENHTVYDVEIQTTSSGHLQKRSRYYQAIIDLHLIEKGMAYKDLNKSFVIFICTFDLFGQGRHIYTFENLCKEDPTLALGDDTTKIFLNAKGTMDDVTPELKAFLDYIAGEVSDDPFVQSLEEEVEHVRSNTEWRRDYMKWYVDRMDLIEEGITIGKAEGKVEGIAEGRTEGIDIGRQQIIANVLSQQKNIEKTVKILGCSYSEVAKVAKNQNIQVNDLLQ